jgi:hypothetical protein
MIIAAIYPIFRRIKLFRWFASNTMWFDFHLMAGTVGPMFVALHSALRLGNVTPGNLHTIAAFWSMIITVVSGFLGRYLYTQVPELSSGVEPRSSITSGRSRRRARSDVPMAEIDRELAEHRAKAQRVAMSPSLPAGVVVAAVSGHRADPAHVRATRLARPARRRSRDPQGPRRRAARMIDARRHVVVPKAQLLLHSWKSPRSVHDHSHAALDPPHRHVLVQRHLVPCCRVI